MRLANVGKLSVSRKLSYVLRKFEMILSYPAVRWPFQLYHSLLLNSEEWLCKTSESRRCGSFCEIHWVKSLRRVCKSGI